MHTGVQRNGFEMKLSKTRAMQDDSSNRECCIQMMKDIYSLFELLDDRKNMLALEDYFRGEFNMEINEN